MERVKRIELSRPAWKAGALPLSYTRMFGGGRRIRTFEIADNGFTVRPLWPLGNPSNIFILMSLKKPFKKNGAGDGTRTRDLLITSQLLYQLSYTGNLLQNAILEMATQKGLEPSTSSVTG